jgi:uncharacterized protein (TIGR03437 family)
LPTVLADVSVTVTVGNTSSSAIILGVYYGYQVNAVLPSATPVGTGTITVTYGGLTSAPAPIQVVPASFGIYTANSQGKGQAAATDPAFNQNSIIHTFHPGDVVILWGTGLGGVSWNETQLPPPSQLVSLAAPVQVYVGNTVAPPAPSDYHGRSGCCAGLDEVVFTAPAGVEGCHVPVGVKAGAVMSNVATIAISNTGQTCSDSPMGQDLVDKLAAGENVKFGWIRLEGGAGTGDYAGGTFNEFSPATAKLASYGVSSGYCIALEWGGNNGLFLTDLTLPFLNAGPALTAQGPLGTYQIPEFTFPPGAYYTVLSTNARVLWAGSNFTVSGAGGPDVVAFTTSKTMPVLGSPITNIAYFSDLSRSDDLAIEWAPNQFSQPNGVATLGGLSLDYNSDGSFHTVAEIQCTVPVAPGHFTIPAWVLSVLPPSGTAPPNGGVTGFLWLGQYDTPTPFTATGLDKGIISAATFSLNVVKFH